MGQETEKLWKSEDYWAIWYALVLFVGIVAGVISFVPKVGTWAANPLEAFPIDLAASIAFLGIGLGLLMTVGIRVMRADWRKFFAVPSVSKGTSPERIKTIP